MQPAPHELVVPVVKMMCTVVEAREMRPGLGYAEFCEAAGVEPVPGGYGVLLLEKDGGDRKMLLSPDVELCRMVGEAMRQDSLPSAVIKLSAAVPFTTVSEIEP